MLLRRSLRGGKGLSSMAQAGKRFSRVSETLGRHVPPGELLGLMAEGDARIALTRFEGIELADAKANGATFETVVFSGCTFEHVDFSRSTFSDVLFADCRFLQCRMGRCWLSQCDFRSCSAPGMPFDEGRLSNVSADCCQMRYASFAAAAIDRFRASETVLAESSWHRARIKRLELDGCDLAHADFFGAPLAGVDLSRAVIDGLVVSDTFRELRGCIVSPAQAVDLARLLGVVVDEG